MCSIPPVNVSRTCIPRLLPCVSAQITTNRPESENIAGWVGIQSWVFQRVVCPSYNWTEPELWVGIWHLWLDVRNFPWPIGIETISEVVVFKMIKLLRVLSATCSSDMGIISVIWMGSAEINQQRRQFDNSKSHISIPLFVLDSKTPSFMRTLR